MQFIMMKVNISKIEALLGNLEDISSLGRSGQNKNIGGSAQLLAYL